MLNITRKIPFICRKWATIINKIFICFSIQQNTNSAKQKKRKRREKNETYGKVTLFKMSNITIRRSRVGYIMNDEKETKR